MAKEKTKNPAEVNVEEKLKNLYALQTTLTQMDKVKTLRGERPREEQDLEDEIEGLTTRIEKIGKEMEVIKRDIAVMNETLRSTMPISPATRLRWTALETTASMTT